MNLVNHCNRLNLITLVVVALFAAILFAGCTSNANQNPEYVKEAVINQGEVEPVMIYAHVNNHVLEIVPENNSSTAAFIELLKKGDISINMHDYGNFEKVGPLGTNLPTNDTQITTQPGDVILYQGNQITIYYDTNSWNFTKLGKIKGLSQKELKNILGEGNVTVNFSLQ
ncbi:cyclophilin-like fold protein [Anaerovibrio sp. RM50]|uniref:cyclophilin-like fold protein n=1 Tax=Anaerovibrio sp. RM50 TaxID=1200557 RepID=UPI0018DEC4AD|nr:cyclophilin-like fold protein [Anaerovibrio sp. RM50]